MLKVLFVLLDGFSPRRLIVRIVLTIAGAAAVLVGLGFLGSALFQVVAGALGTLDAALIFGIAFIVIGLGLVGVAGMQWNRRPRPLLARSRYLVVAEALGLAQTLIRKEPAKAILGALALGALTEFSRKKGRREEG